MKNIFIAIISATIFLSCNKKDKPEINNCNIQQVYEKNASKVNITKGIWGTVAFMEGNCMPVYGEGSTCKTCAVKRTIRIYEYTMRNQASPQNAVRFYDNFSTQLVQEIETDDQGFYQTSLPNGNYTIVVLEEGKLYGFGFDGQGGISTINFNDGLQKINLTLNYKAVF